MINMTKRITIHFQHAELWEEFTEKIKEQYGTTRVHRTEELEKLLSGYIHQENIQHELNEIKEKYAKENKELTQTKILNDQLLEENRRLQQYTENNDRNIDDFKESQKNNHLLIQQQQIQLQQLQEQLQKLQEENSRKDNQLLAVSEQHEKTIKSLEDKNTSKDNDYKHIVEVMNKVQREKSDLEKQIQTYSYVLGSIQSMSLMNRILKRYPEEIKELKPSDIED